MLVIDEDGVRSVLRYDTLIPAMAQALADLSAGKSIQPVRTVLSIPRYGNSLFVMPAVCGDIMGTKMVALVPSNAERGTPTHVGTVQIFRTDTGEPLATLDGRLITEMRTAAVSAVAVNLLAARSAHSLAILGSGVQARSHARAIRTVRNITDIRIWSIDTPGAQACAKEIGGTYCATAEAAVRGADIVATVTASHEPILLGEWLTPHACVVAVGAAGATHRELDSEAVLRGTAIVDSRAAAQVEAGEILLANAPIYGELGELISGALPLPTRGPFVFKALGQAVEDITAAQLVYDAVAKNSARAHTQLPHV